MNLKMKNFIIAILTNMPEMLIDTTTITTVNVPKCYQIDLTYENGTPVEIKTQILKDWLKKQGITYTYVEKKDRYGGRCCTISFVNKIAIECNFVVFNIE